MTTTTTTTEPLTTSESASPIDTEAGPFSSVQFITSSIPAGPEPTTLTTSTIPQTTANTTASASLTSTEAASDATVSAYHTPSPSSHSTLVSAAQIAGIAIGSGAFFCLVAALFFFFGRRDAGRPTQTTNHRLSMRDVGAGLGTVKTKFGAIWGRGDSEMKQRRQGEDVQGPVELSAERVVELPAELPAALGFSGEKQGDELMERQVHFVFRPPVVKELDGASVVSHKEISPSPERQQEQQEQQHHHQTTRLQSQEAEISPVPDTSGEDGVSTLPRYEELDNEARSHLFSGAAPESAYRPDKSWYED